MPNSRQGFGTLLECISPAQARLHAGEAQLVLPQPEKAQDKTAKDNAAKDNPAKKPVAKGNVPFELLAPRGGGRRVATPGKVFLRVDRDEKLVEVEELPKWLGGFESTTSHESLGSLIVNLPDGRSEPLGVGYHKVSVEIRDQIARTTIEESFVNHTAARLEGVFHFPLPQDASISGFGMWIGDALIEADVVEKQRAREIYETILRERRDPALLEWTSGNLFKARVFPILPDSEKRVKIVYTQVLPLRGSQYRYVYGLRSDLLRTRPLRELSLQVTVSSAMALASVRCPTHATRIQQTEHAAQVEFAAQQYSPDRDFEVVCETSGKQSDVVAVPHRRGTDGYLLVQLTPPAAEGNWRRDVLPDGPRLNLVLLCDTSGSIDSEKRQQQAEFVAAILASLGERDRFLLAATDVSTSWSAPEPLAPTADNVASARDFLEQRASLGWTDLDQAFDAVRQKAPANAHIVYIGDGIVSAGDRDPSSFVKRLAKRWADKPAGGLTLKPAGGLTLEPAGGLTLHAVTVGNTSESVVMQGIAAAGGGSLRTIGGEQSAPAVALELLSEIARPGLRDLKVEFRGVKVAAVYPDRLPNLAAGTQQILVARYLPDGQDQSGEIVVTGKRGTEPVRYSATIRFQDAEQGNSFIPRLWARAHLDHLLGQGDNPAIRDDIIALSEVFHIITPYTSLLVLESDADRQRFGVKRRNEMRDGERFFAAGKDDAQFELAEQQMKRSAEWRLDLRGKILRELATHDRDARMFRSQPDPIDLERLTRSLNEWTTNRDEREGAVRPGIIRLSPTTEQPDRFYSATLDDSAAATSLALLPDLRRHGGDVESPSGGIGGGVLGAADFKPMAAKESTAEMMPLDLGELDSGDDAALWPDPAGSTNANRTDGSLDELGDEEALWSARDQADRSDDALDSRVEQDVTRSEQIAGGKPGGGNALEELRARGAARSQGMAMAACMIPEMPRYFPDGYGFAKLAPVPDSPAAARRPGDWTPAAFALSRSLLRLDALGALGGGIELRSADDLYESGWPQPTSRSGSLVLYSRNGWLTRPTSGDGETVVNYCRNKQRGGVLAGLPARTDARSRPARLCRPVQNERVVAPAAGRSVWPRGGAGGTSRPRPGDPDCHEQVCQGRKALLDRHRQARAAASRVVQRGSA